MINYIKIKNYQSHKDTFIQFKDGLNIITGASDSGKSVVLRAFCWLKNNRPLGDEIKNWDAKVDDIISVEISIDDIIVGKERKNKKNIYYIVKGGKKKTFEAVGKDVPEQIEDILGLSDINIQLQHDKYFLLDSGISSGEVAKKFNEMVGLDIIDKAFKNFASNISKNKSELERIENSINESKQNLERLSFVDSFLPLFIEQKNKNINLDQDKGRIFNIAAILQKKRDISSEKSKLEQLLNFEKTIDYLNGQYSQIEQLRNRYNKINQLLFNYKQILKKILTSSSLIKFVDRLDSLIIKIKELEDEKKVVNFVSVKINSLNAIRKMSIDANESLNNNTTLLKIELRKLGICPLCGGTLTAEKINHFIELDSF